MIKSRLIAILLSGCLTTGVGAGSYFLNSENPKIINIKEVVEAKLNESNKNSNDNKENSNNQIDDNSKENASNENTSNDSTTENSNTDTEKVTETPKENETTKPDTINNETPANNEVIPSETTTGGTQAEASDSYIAEIEQAIFARVNQERAAAGLPALSYNNTMQHYARLKSKDMGDRGYFDHTNPEGKLITEQMKADGVSYKAWGENIAYISGVSGNAKLATQFMDNWMNSSGHRANILSSNFSSIGVGVYKIGNTYYATQEFYK